MPIVKGEPSSCYFSRHGTYGDCNGTDPRCRCCPYGCHPETGAAYKSWAESRLLPSTRVLAAHTHRWSGWPGAFCLHCGIADPSEEALADDRFDTWMYHAVACPPCPAVPYGADPYNIPVVWIEELANEVEKEAGLWG